MAEKILTKDGLEALLALLKESFSEQEARITALEQQLAQAQADLNSLKNSNIVGF